MLNFITGRAGTGKTTLIREKIAHIASSSDQPIVVIVPEQQTVAWETALAELLPPSVNLRLEITNFTRLANSVFREYGGLADTLVDEGVRSLLIWRAMVSVWDQMKVYNNADGREDRNISALMQAVDELKNSGVSPEDAETALEQLERMRGEQKKKSAAALTARLRDAVLVYSAYQSILHEEYIDRGDLLQKLGDKLERHPYFRGKAVFVDSFFSLTKAEERILGLIFRQTEDVWISFACQNVSHSDSDEIQFGEVRAFLKTAEILAARAGREVNFIRLTENHRYADNPELLAVEKHLFNYADDLPDVKLNGQRRVRIIRCADRYDEGELCASVIDGLLRRGYRYSEIAVVARNMKTREGIVDAALRRHGIRCFVSESSMVSASPAVRLIYSALMVGAGNWQRKDVIRLLKTGMTPVTLDDNGEMAGEVMELYTRTWNIRGRKSYGKEWRMNPSGYKMELTERDRILLGLANQAREKLVPPLERLLDVFADEQGKMGLADVREIAERIVEFAEECRVTEAAERKAQVYREMGLTADAEKVSRSWDMVCRILDKLVLALDGTKLDAGKFAGLFMRTAQSLDISTIPTGIDEVVLGSSSGVRFEGVRCVIMLGSVAGEFPGTVSDDAFFDDSDRVALESVGVVLGSPDKLTKTAREYFMYYRTAASAAEELYILAPMETGELSEGAARIGKILPGCVEDFAKMPLDRVVYHRASAEYLLSRRTDPAERRILERILGTDGGKAFDAVPLTAVNDRIEPVQTGMQTRSRVSMTQSRIESFVMCPFNYSCRYLMKLYPEVRAEIAPPDIGNFIHSILERFFGETDPATLSAALENQPELEKLTDGFIEEYLDELGRNSDPDGGGKHTDNGRLSYLFMRLRRHVLVFVRALAEELQQSRFVPAAFELPVGSGGITIPMDEGEVQLRGVVDRVDLYEAEDGKKYIRVIDYKTGSKSFSMEDVRRGIGVQLLIYLFTVWKNGLPGVNADDVLPAGAVYFSVKPTVLSEKRMLSPEEAVDHAKSAIEKSGVVLAEEEILRAMDAELSGKFAPVKSTSTGLKGLNGTVCLPSVEEFGKLQAELESILYNIFTEMKAGTASARPARIGDRNPCEWCEHRYICKRTIKG